MQSWQRLFRAKGRISRARFWMRCALIWLTLAMAKSILSDDAFFALTIFAALTLLALSFACVQRLHDRGYSAKNLLLTFLPVIGPAWLFWQLGCRSGEASENVYGPDPKQVNVDFLVVS